jgi:hypothetical protein
MLPVAARVLRAFLRSRLGGRVRLADRLAVPCSKLDRVAAW